MSEFAAFPQVGVMQALPIALLTDLRSASHVLKTPLPVTVPGPLPQAFIILHNLCNLCVINASFWFFSKI